MQEALAQETEFQTDEYTKEHGRVKSELQELESRRAAAEKTGVVSYFPVQRL
jgi:hypothetical protein